jgi:glucose-6-phosphate isomerase
MLNVDSNNVLAGKIGSGNGIKDTELSVLCDKYQPLVGKVFAAKKQAGYNFLELPGDMTLLRKIKKFADEQAKQKWENIVVLGIGGSALGAIAIRDALLKPFQQTPRLHIVDNIDPAYLSALLSSIQISKSLFVVISKSGTTTEPMVQYAVIKEMLMKKHPKNYQKHLVFITDPKSGLLRKMAEKEGIVTFDVPQKVGGRFSVLSSVGLLPAALAGVDISGLLRGARDITESIKKLKGVNNPALLLATLQYFMDQKRSKSMTVLMPYSNHLFRLGDWYRQLLAESIGKNPTTGPTPINALGTTDQHSQLQLYVEGPNNKLIIFFRVLKHAKDFMVPNVLPKEIGQLNNKSMSRILDASYLGTAESLAKASRPNLTIEVPKIDAKNMGALFMLFEFQVALLGLLYKVDAFNQPGVEHSKTITKQLLS